MMPDEYEHRLSNLICRSRCADGTRGQGHEEGSLCCGMSPESAPSRGTRWRSACRLLSVDLAKVRAAFDRRCWP